MDDHDELKYDSQTPDTTGTHKSTTTNTHETSATSSNSTSTTLCILHSYEAPTQGNEVENREQGHEKNSNWTTKLQEANEESVITEGLTDTSETFTPVNDTQKYTLADGTLISPRTTAATPSKCRFVEEETKQESSTSTPYNEAERDYVMSRITWSYHSKSSQANNSFGDSPSKETDIISPNSFSEEAAGTHLGKRTRNFQEMNDISNNLQDTFDERSEKQCRLKDDIRSLETLWTTLDSKAHNIISLSSWLRGSIYKTEKQLNCDQRKLKEREAMMREDHVQQLGRSQVLHEQCTVLYSRILEKEAHVEAVQKESEHLAEQLHKVTANWNDQCQRSLDAELSLEDTTQKLNIQSKRCSQLLESLNDETKQRRKDSLKLKKLYDDQARKDETINSLKHHLNLLRHSMEGYSRDIHTIKQYRGEIQSILDNEARKQEGILEKSQQATEVLGKAYEKAIKHSEMYHHGYIKLETELNQIKAENQNNTKEITELNEFIKRQKNSVDSAHKQTKSDSVTIAELEKERNSLMKQIKQLPGAPVGSTPQQGSHSGRRANRPLEAQPQERSTSPRNQQLSLIHVATGKQIEVDENEEVSLGRILLCSHDIFIKSPHISRNHVKVSCNTEQSSLVVRHCGRNCSYIITRDFAIQCGITMSAHSENQDMVCNRVASLFQDESVFDRDPNALCVLRSRDSTAEVAQGDLILLQRSEETAFLVV